MDERSRNANYGGDLLVEAARRETRGDLREDQRQAARRVGQQEPEGRPVGGCEGEGGLEEHHQEADPAD